jgi:hypothetical protein
MPQKQIYPSVAERQRAYRERVKKQRAVELEQKNLPPLPAVPTMPGTARWDALIAAAITSLETVRDEMKTYADERTERWQESEKGEAFGERLEQIENLISELEDL